MLEKSYYYLNAEMTILKKSDIKKLSEILNYHSDLYHNKEEPVISDIEYDLLLKKLQELEDAFGVSGKFSNKVGEEIIESSFEKVAHTRPMISLDNTYNSDDLQDFDSRVKKHIGDTSIKDIEYCLEYKFDGLGIELIYKDGKFTQAITRGNGVEGEDVTENIRGIANIPKTIEYKNYLEIRGEVVMPISSFNMLNEKAKTEGTKIFSNPRNAASGSVRMKDSNITKQRKLQFFAYDIGNFSEYINSKTHPQPLSFPKEGRNYFSVIKSIESLGFEISSYFKKFPNIGSMAEAIDNFGDFKSKIDFEVDGLVLKVDDVTFWQDIGFTQHHPRYAIAYKFPAEVFTTTILSVDHQIGRTGTITPAANLEPVNMGGAIIRRATLHNYEEVEKLGIKTGDRVFIKRAGEVIPKVISLASAGEISEEIKVPEYCPSCSTKIQKDEDKVRYYCPNFESCPKQVSEQLIYAVGKSGFNIDGMGERQVEIFLQEKIITDLSDIFILERKQEQILALEGFQEKSVENILAAIEKVKNTQIDIVIRSLGITGVGKKTAKNLSILFESETDILNFSHSLEIIEEISDIGPEVAKNVSIFFHTEKNKILLEKLSNLLHIEYYNKPIIDENSFFLGKTVCITGSFEHNGEKVSRDSLVEKLEKSGGKFTGSVSKKTDFLLAGEKAGSKLKKAQDLGVNTLTLEQFIGHI